MEKKSNPQTLGNDQHEFREIHYKMNHLPLLVLITLAEKGKSMSSSKIAYQHACHAFLDKPIVNLGVPRVLMVQFKKESDGAPGKCVSMDTLVSAQPGLVPQKSGFLTHL